MSALLATLRLVAHATARLETEINAAIVILASRIELRRALPECLFFPFAFI
jgi:hypothetical protein